MESTKLIEFRYRPKDDFLIRASWEELYSLTSHWISELTFYADEILFFERLLKTHNSMKDPKLEEMDHMIIDMNVQLRSIVKQTDEHLNHIIQFLKGNPDQAYLFREEHNVLEDTIVAFTKEFQTLRRTLFAEMEVYV